MKLLKRCVLPALSSIILILCSCTQTTPDVLEGLVNNIDTNTAKAVESVKYKDYRDLFSEYKEKNAIYFSDTEAAINTILGQKYAYGLTAYRHSDELAEIAEMFFDDNAENTLNIYFALRGFENKEYQEEENTAQYNCSKKDEAYVYKASYDKDNRCFEITLEINGVLKDSLKCCMNDESLTKYCYRGSLDRTFIICVNKDKTSKIDWYEGFVENGEEKPEDDHGYIVYDGKILTGVIK